MDQTLDPINPQQILLENTILGLGSESALPGEPSSCRQKGRAVACEFSCDLATKKGERRGVCLHGVPVAEHPHPISQTTDICGLLHPWAPLSMGSSIHGLLHPWAPPSMGSSIRGLLHLWAPPSVGSSMHGLIHPCTPPPMISEARMTSLTKSLGNIHSAGGLNEH